MKIILATLLTLLALLTACNRSSPAFPNDGKLRVVATFLPIHAHTAAIAGDRAHVHSIIPGEVGAHDYWPTPGDMKSIADAQLLIANGGGMEPWLDHLIKTAKNKNLKTIDLSTGIPLLENPPIIHGDDAHTQCDHGDHNPHFWLDPVLAIHQAEAIRDALIAADPEGRDTYTQNATRYIAQLNQLHQDFQTILAPLPDKKLVTFHDAFPYLAARYGLQSIGYISEFPERDPSPAQLAALIENIRKHQVKVLFAETGYEPALLQRIAAETGTTIATLDTIEIGTLGPDAYLNAMRNNLQTLQQAFAP